METARVIVAPTGLKPKRPTDHEFPLVVEWQFMDKPYKSLVKLFKTSGYMNGGHYNAGAWYLSIRNHKGEYVETRITREALAQFDRQLMRALQEMDRENGHATPEAAVEEKLGGE